jgi:hypothetical protein
MRKSIILLTALCFSLSGGCASKPASPYTQYVDERSGESMASTIEPTRFVAERPALSRVGKDYLFAAPVRVSGFDAPRTYLWFGVGSSIDRRITGASIPGVNSIVLLVDDMPMTFDLVRWSEVTPSEPFALDVEHYTSYGARVTGSQLRRIAAANSLRAFVANEDNRSPAFIIAGGAHQTWAGL